ncbi:unnamed protein product [Arabis nemorensis]|uniref:Uncharacterized protein n=1 Tax=Arabis nemorensis TaxID=586526 RepID=A0A565CP59_9BRAS|nr:unnamed protein product [Arabis nemorensis]
MHLWPSLKLRNSFKSSSKKRFQREQTQSNRQKLLGGEGHHESSPEVSSGCFAVVCRDLAMLLSCCGGMTFEHYMQSPTAHLIRIFVHLITSVEILAT